MTIEIYKQQLYDENDIHVYTNSWIKARRAYRKAKKMFYSAFIIRNDKNIKEIEK